MIYEMGSITAVAEVSCEDCGLGEPIGSKGDPGDLHPDIIYDLAMDHHSKQHPTCPGEVIVDIEPEVFMNGDPDRFYRYRPGRCRYN